MEIIIISSRSSLTKTITDSIDSSLKYHNADLISLNPKIPKTLEQFKSLVQCDKFYLIIADIKASKDQLKLCKLIQQHSARCKFLLIGQTNETCRRAVQIHLNIWDYFNEGERCLHTKIANSVLSFLESVRTTCSGIFVRQEMDYRFIPFDEIYYIETIKHTHTCIVYHHNGQGTIRESIRHLCQSLDSRFGICRSSTIANFSKISRIDYKNNLLYFTNHIFCSFTASKRKLVDQIITGKVMNPNENCFHD